MGGDVARMAEKRNACRFFVARGEGIIHGWVGLRFGFSIIFKSVLKKDAQLGREMSNKNISWWVKAAYAYG